MSGGRATNLRVFIFFALLAFVQARVIEMPGVLEAGPTAGADCRLIAVCTAALPVFARIEAKPHLALKPDAANKLLSADGRRAAGRAGLKLPIRSPRGGANLTICQRPLWLLHRVLLI